MSWVFIVCRNNNVEQVKVFTDFWDAASFTDRFIEKIDQNIEYFPQYNRGENYKNGDLTVGLYKGE